MTLRPWIALMLAAAASLAQADAVDTLREFVRDVKSGQASFTQTVVSTDGARKNIVEFTTIDVQPIGATSLC